METILYDKNGEAAAYIVSDFHETIYLWEGLPAAYLYEEDNVFGFNGRHLGWFRADVLYNHRGERVGFTHTTCPVSIAKPPVKGKKVAKDEMRSRYGTPPLPKLLFHAAQEGLADFLKQGLVTRFEPEAASSEPSE
jgi:hypothetical protein